MSATLDRLMDVTRRFVVGRGGDAAEVAAESAVCQDLLIFGVDVDDYVHHLHESFGDVVWQVPWLRFTDQTSSFRGLGCLWFPFWWSWRLARWPFAGGPIIPRPDPRNFPERLSLNHLAAVIDAGCWFEPGQLPA